MVVSIRGSSLAIRQMVMASMRMQRITCFRSSRGSIRMAEIRDVLLMAGCRICVVLDLRMGISLKAFLRMGGQMGMERCFIRRL